jgi:hypothetical protein
VEKEKGGLNMADKKTMVLGIYPTQASLEFGVKALKDAGFRPTDISVLYPEKQDDNGSGHMKEEAAAEGAATGASAGAVVGGVLGWLVGIGSLAIPGMGAFIAAGPIVATLVGASAAGAVGGVAGGLVGIGVPGSKANSLQERIKDNGILLSVHSNKSYWTKRAQKILERTGAQDISSSEETGADQGKTDYPFQSSACYWACGPREQNKDDQTALAGKEKMLSLNSSMKRDECTDMPLV